MAASAPARTGAARFDNVNLLAASWHLVEKPFMDLARRSPPPERAPLEAPALAR